MSEPRRAVLALAVGGSILAISTAAILIRESSAPPVVIAFYRLLYATLILAPFAWWHARDELRALTRRDWLGLGAVGVVLALHFASWITSLDLTSVASSVVLVTLHPVFVAVMSQRLFKEGVSARGFVGILVALAGGALIAIADSQGGLGSNPIAGDALALVGAAAAAVYFLSGRGYRRRLGLLAYVTPVYAASTVTLALLVVLLPAPYGGSFAGHALRDHALFALMALVPMIGGHTVLNWALKYVSAPVIATTILGEPVGSTILAVIVLGEYPPVFTLIGGAIVLAGIGLVALASDEARQQASQPVAPE